MELIKELRWEQKFTNISNNVSQKLIRVGTYFIHHYNLLLKVLQHDTLRQRIRHLYNTTFIAFAALFVYSTKDTSDIQG